jgi:CRISP-associated protein Cas1
MAWRGIHLSRSAHLGLKQQALRIRFKDDQGGEFRIPLEDLAYLIIDRPDISLTSRLMAEMAQKGVCVIGVDERHLPSWISLPTGNFYRPGEIIQLQLNISEPIRKRVWKEIVINKLKMQAGCLQRLGKKGMNEISSMASRVKSGDADNIEARGARAYWKCIFDDRTFTRHSEDLPNALLNYGYAIVRSCIARILCGKGFIPQIGIWHHSVSNAFNLADDLLEPFRPVVDHRAYQVLNGANSDTPLTLDHRRAMTLVMESSVDVYGDKLKLINAIEVCVDSLRETLIQKEVAEMRFPAFLNS